MGHTCYKKWPIFEKGVPGAISIDDNAPEEAVLDLILKLNVSIDPSNVEDYHRLKSTNNAPEKVILRL